MGKKDEDSLIDSNEKWNFVVKSVLVNHSLEEKAERPLISSTVKLGNKELFGHPKIVP